MEQMIQYVDKLLDEDERIEDAMHQYALSKLGDRVNADDQDTYFNMDEYWAHRAVYFNVLINTVLSRMVKIA